MAISSTKIYFFNLFCRIMPPSRCGKMKVRLLRWAGAKVGKNVSIFTPRILASQLSIIGRYSLNIYIIHFFLVPHIVVGLPNTFIFHLVYSLALAIVTSYVSIAIGRLLTAMTPLDKVLR